MTEVPAAARPAKSRRGLIVAGAAVVGVLLLAVGVANVKVMQVPSQSMAPTAPAGSRIFINKAAYWFGEPSRGDVVLMTDPGGWLPAGSGHYLLKRVVGVAGDTVICCTTDGRLSINGAPVDESDHVMAGAPCAVPLSIQADRPCSRHALHVGPIPEGYLFVLGDNRNNSADSSVHLCYPRIPDCPPTQGLVPVDNVVGKLL